MKAINTLKVAAFVLCVGGAAMANHHAHMLNKLPECKAVAEACKDKHGEGHHECVKNALNDAANAACKTAMEAKKAEHKK